MGSIKIEPLLILNQYQKNRVKDLISFSPEDSTRCRVIEVWRKESKERLRVHDRLTGEYYKVEITDEKSLLANNAARRLEQAAAGVDPNFRLLMTGLLIIRW